MFTAKIKQNHWLGTYGTLGCNYIDKSLFLLIIHYKFWIYPCTCKNETKPVVFVYKTLQNTGDQYNKSFGCLINFSAKTIGMVSTRY